MMKELHFYTLLMSIVMIAMCPQRLWAENETIEVSTPEEFYNVFHSSKVTASVRLTADISMTKYIAITTAETYSIDLNNHILSYSGSDWYCLFSNHGTLSIKNGTCKSSKSAFDNYGTLTIENCNVICESVSCLVNNNSSSIINVGANTNLATYGGGGALAFYLYAGKININGTCSFYARNARTIGDANQNGIHIDANYQMIAQDGTAITDFSDNCYHGSAGQYLFVIKNEACSAGTHSMEQHAAVPAANLTPGSIAYWHCKTCGRNYSESDGNTTPLNYSQIHTLPLLEDGVFTNVSVATVAGKCDSEPSHYNLYRYTAPASGTLTVYASGWGDSYGALFNAELTERLTCDDNSNGNNDFKFSYDVVKDQVYYIGIRETDYNLVGYTITVSGSWPVTIADGEVFSTTKQYAHPASRVEIARSFVANKPASLMLPFSVKASLLSGAKVYTFSGVTREDSKWVAVMTEVSGTEATIEAYKPYIVILDGSNTTGKMTFDGGTTDVATFPVTPAAASMVTADDESVWTFKALNENKTWAEGDAELGKAYAFAGKDADGVTVNRGDFVKLAAGANAKPGRCYLVKEGSLTSNSARARAAETETLPASIAVRFVSSETTGIATLDTKTGEMSTVVWYDLNGRRLNGPVKGGILIRNNKKILVK